MKFPSWPDRDEVSMEEADRLEDEGREAYWNEVRESDCPYGWCSGTFREYCWRKGWEYGANSDLRNGPFD